MTSVRPSVRLSAMLVDCDHTSTTKVDIVTSHGSICLGYLNKMHLKNVGPIHYCEPPHAHSPGVASGTVARRLRIDVHDANDIDDDDDNDDNDNA